MDSVDTRLPLKRARGSIMPKPFNVKVEEFSATVKLGGIRGLPVLSFLPYFSNSSKPRVKFAMSFDDPNGLYVITGARIMGAGGIEWVQENVELGHQYNVTLPIITKPSVYDYTLEIQYMDKGETRNVNPWRRAGRILNTGSVQSSENWFMWLLCFFAGVGITVIGWVLFS